MEFRPKFTKLNYKQLLQKSPLEPYSFLYINEKVHQLIS